ncbi:hypothetical protein BHM03_00037010, partial [Ensete ventricosum]
MQNESLNGGGTLFVSKHPDLKVRVVHGNTLTAAVILNEIPRDVKEVFLTGATSKLGRAIALYLCKKNIRVLGCLGKKGGFESYRAVVADVDSGQVAVAEGAEVGAAGHLLPPVRGAAHHRFQEGLHLRESGGHEAPQGRSRAGVVRGSAAAYTMERGVVHACHAGGVVHCLEGWTHHEVGAIDVDRIDTDHYRAVPPKSTVGSRLREKLTVGDQLREKKKKKKKRKRKKNRRREKYLLAHTPPPPSPAGDFLPRETERLPSEKKDRGGVAHLYSVSPVLLRVEKAKLPDFARLLEI